MRKPDRRKGPGGPVVHTDGFPGDIPHFDAERFAIRYRHYLKRSGQWSPRMQLRPCRGWGFRWAAPPQSFRRTKHGRGVFPGGRVRYGVAALCCFLALFNLSAYGAISATAAGEAGGLRMNWYGVFSAAWNVLFVLLMLLLAWLAFEEMAYQIRRARGLPVKGWSIGGRLLLWLRRGRRVNQEGK